MLSKQFRRRLARGKEPEEILRAQLMGGSVDAVKRVAQLFDKKLVEALLEGSVYHKEEPLLTRLWDEYPDLFHVMPTYKNVMGQNMEIVSCWSIRRMSSDFPAISFASPSQWSTIGFEESLLAFTVKNLFVVGGGAAMRAAGSHAFATISNQASASLVY